MSSYVRYYTYIVSKSRMFEEYVVGYDETTDPPTPVMQNDVVVPETTLSGDVTSFSVSGDYIEPNTTYYVKLTACNKAGCSSVVIGPITTAKEGEAIETIPVKYTQDPLTGYVKIWWEADTVPAKTVFSYGAYNGSTYDRFFTVYNQCYMELALSPGVYKGRLDIYSKEEDTTPYTFELIGMLIVRQYVVGGSTDELTEMESSGSRTPTTYLVCCDNQYLEDSSSPCPVVPLAAVSVDVLYLEDELERGPSESAYVIASSSLTTDDGLTNSTDPTVYIEVSGGVDLEDDVTSPTHAAAYIVYGDNVDLFDTVSSREEIETFTVESCFEVVDSSELRVGGPYTVIDRLTNTDTPVSTIAFYGNDGVEESDGKRVFVDCIQPPSVHNPVEMVEPVTYAEGPYEAENCHMDITDEVVTYDVYDEDSMVGELYDFSHVKQNGGD